MSKYIVDTDKYYLHEFDGALIVMMHEGKPVSVYESKDNLEELTSDYINEHYDGLQEEAYQKGYDAGIIACSYVDKSDEAYQRGLEDAWKLAEDMIYNRGNVLYILRCATVGSAFDKYSAGQALDILKEYERKQKDSIDVGDEVMWKTDDITLIVTSTYKNGGCDWCDGVAQDGKTYHTLAENNQKTGKHYDIQSILEAMRK